MSVYKKYVSQALQIYDDALRLLERGDIFDAVEKAWSAIENARKALLIAVGVPEQKAGSVEFGVGFFIRILRKLGRKDIVEKYYGFDYCLHIKGFYELQMPPDLLSEKIYEAEGWISEVLGLIDKLKNVDLKDAIKMMEESIKLKRRILQLNIEYRQALQQIDNAISRAVTQKA